MAANPTSDALGSYPIWISLIRVASLHFRGTAIKADLGSHWRLGGVLARTGSLGAVSRRPPGSATCVGRGEEAHHDRSIARHAGMKFFSLQRT